MQKTSGSARPVNTDAGVPLHRQLFLVLHDEIARGAMAPGDALPTEQTLCDQFGVSRITVRRALADLAEQGYIDSWSVVPAPEGDAGALLEIRLKYTEDRRSAISGLRRVSRPGRRTYVDAKHIPKVLGGMGTSIVSTSRGVMTGHDARAAGVGGEVLAQVW